MAIRTVGFIGTGVMGRSMADHLMKAGYTLHVYNRTKEKAKSLMDSGAVWHDSPSSLSAACDAIITMVGYPKDVEETYFSPAGILANAKKGSLVIDMTTSSPALAVKIASAAAVRGLLCLDAPVSGGDLGARNATLTIMCGGSQEAFAEAVPLFEKMGKTIKLQGPAGSGQNTKMANQIVIAGNLCGTCEAMTYSKKAGLNPSIVLESISSGSAGSWQLTNLAPKMIAGDFAPGFYVKHFVKDLGIALESAREMGLELPILGLANKLFTELSSSGRSELGTHALFLLYQERAKAGNGGV